MATLRPLGAGAVNEVDALDTQSFSAMKTNFKDANQAVGASATWSWFKVGKTNQVKATATFKLLQNNDELFSPIGNQYKTFAFRVTDFHGHISLYNMHGITACQIDIPNQSVFNNRIRDILLVGTRKV